MSDSNSTSVSFPIPYNPDDKRPLPQIIADYCGFSLASHPVDDTIYYSVQDWIVGVAHAKNPRRFWSDMKRLAKEVEIELYDSVVQLLYQANNRKHYKMDYVTDESLYRITQRMRAETGIRDEVLRYLAKAGVKIDEYRIDPEKALDAVIEMYQRMGKTEKWIEVRLLSTVRRHRFTAAFKRSLRIPPARWQYAVITDTVYIGLWKRDSATLKLHMGLKKNANLRDHQSALAILYQSIAEEMSSVELDEKDALEFKEAQDIVRSSSEFVGKQADEASHRLGIDIATNRPLLKGNSD